MACFLLAPEPVPPSFPFRLRDVGLDMVSITGGIRVMSDAGCGARCGAGIPDQVCERLKVDGRIGSLVGTGGGARSPDETVRLKGERFLRSAWTVQQLFHRDYSGEEAGKA